MIPYVNSPIWLWCYFAALYSSVWSFPLFIFILFDYIKVFVGCNYLFFTKYNNCMIVLSVNTLSI